MKILLLVLLLAPLISCSGNKQKSQESKNAKVTLTQTTLGNIGPIEYKLENIGSNTYSISFNNPTKEIYNIVLSNSRDCTVATSSTCKNSLSAIVAPISVTQLTGDSVKKLVSGVDIYIATEDSNSKLDKYHVSLTKFSPRVNHQAVSFKDKLYIIGGYDDKDKDDVWSSTDGKTWKQETASAGFGMKQGHKAVVHKNKIYVIGGADSDYNKKNEVWSSADGKTWTKVETTKAFTARYGHHVVSFKDKLYLFGGFDGESKNDVWTSENGVEWEKIWPPENTNPFKPIPVPVAFSARYDHQAVVFNNRIYIIGGYNGSIYEGDVWSSANGIEWVKVTNNTAFNYKEDHQAVVFNNKIYVIAGRDVSGTTKDIWSSADGKEWTKITDNATFGAKENHQAVVFKNKLYLLGGYDGSLYNNDSWVSENGKDWKNLTNH